MFCFYFEVETLDLRPPQRCSRLKDGGARGRSAAHGKLIRRMEGSPNRSELRPSTCADSRGGESDWLATDGIDGNVTLGIFTDV